MTSAERSGPDQPDATGPPGPGEAAGAGEGAPRRGGRPSLGPRKGFPLRLPPDVMEQLRAWANQDMRSLNAQIEYLLREALRRAGRERES